MNHLQNRVVASSRIRVAGFSLIEMMVAIVIGMLLTAGIITLFAGTSRTNRVQDALARLQENGRYAMTRIDSDIRMLSGQYCSNFAGQSNDTSNGPTLSQRAPWIYGSPLKFPDMSAPLTYASAAAVSPRLFVQGYECSSGTCVPALPSGVGQIPDVGTTDGKRLKGTDVLTIRYITGTGWPVSGDVATPPSCTSGGTITLDPQTGDDNPEANTPARPKFAAGDMALYTDCENPSILPVAGYGSNLLTLGTILPGGAGGAPTCKAGTIRDARVFNFSRDFVTVSYFVKLVKDTNPDATAGRMIPVLVRRVNGGAANAALGGDDQELVQGVERLDFVYGVRKNGGGVAYLDAGTINASTDGGGTCIAPPAGVPGEAGCLWRSVKSIEVHALFNTVSDLALSATDMAYRYTPDSPTTIAPPVGSTSPVTGQNWGRMMRREFVSTTAIRNAN